MGLAPHIPEISPFLTLVPRSFLSTFDLLLFYSHGGVAAVVPVPFFANCNNALTSPNKKSLLMTTNKYPHPFPATNDAGPQHKFLTESVKGFRISLTFHILPQL